MIDWDKINKVTDGDRLTAIRAELVACGLDTVDAEQVIDIIVDLSKRIEALQNVSADLKASNEQLRQRNRELKRRGRRGIT